MSEVRIDQGAVSRIAGRLDEARDAIEGCAGSSPGSVDAGEWTSDVTRLVAAVTKMCGALSEGLSAGSSAATAAGRGVELTDQAQGSALGSTARGLQP